MRTTHSTTNRLLPTVLALILLATLLRLPALGRDSLWLDEAISYLTARLPISSILSNEINDPHPPLYYLFLHLWLYISPLSDAALRLSGILWNLLLIPVIVGLGRLLFQNNRAAIVAALLVAINPFHIFYSHELRMYTFLMFITALTVYAYLRARQGQQWPWWLAFAVSALAAIYTHLFAFPVLVAIGLHALIERRDTATLRRVILVGVVLFILFLPWVAIIAGESQYDLGSLRPLAQAGSENRSLMPLLSTLTFLLFGYSTTAWYTALALFFTLATIAIFLVELRWLRRNQTIRPLLLPALIVILTIGIPVTVNFIRPFFLPERTMAAASPFLLLLLGWGSAQKRGLLRYMVLASAAVMLVGSVTYLQSEPLKPPYRSAITFVAENREAGDLILHTSDGSYLPALRYVDLPQHALLEGDPDPRKARQVYELYGGELWGRDQVGQVGNRLWLVVAREHSIEWQDEQVAYFDSRFEELDSYDFEGVEVRLFRLADK
jgi:uncharacterized membrane protein